MSCIGDICRAARPSHAVTAAWPHKHYSSCAEAMASEGYLCRLGKHLQQCILYWARPDESLVTRSNNEACIFCCSCSADELCNQLADLKKRNDVEQMISNQVRPKQYYDQNFTSEVEYRVSTPACSGGVPGWLPSYKNGNQLLASLCRICECKQASSHARPD